jgi:hypothetical protein
MSDAVAASTAGRLELEEGAWETSLWMAKRPSIT